MEKLIVKKAKTGLKFTSECILILLAVSFVRSILEIFLTDVKIDGVSEGLIIASKIILCVLFAMIIFIPQIYIGVKGIKIAKNPTDSKSHIVWAVIFVIFAFISAISAIVDMVNTGDIAANIFVLIDGVVDIALYLCYIVYAKRVLDAV